MLLIDIGIVFMLIVLVVGGSLGMAVGIFTMRDIARELGKNCATTKETN